MADTAESGGRYIKERLHKFMEKQIKLIKLSGECLTGRLLDCFL